MKVLVTGFEPFGYWQRNPSAETVRHLDGVRIADAEITGLVLPVSFRRVTVPLLEAIDNLRPDVVLSLGLGDPVGIRVERLAVNTCRAPVGLSDNDGYQPDGEPIQLDGPSTYRSTLPVGEMVDLLSDLKFNVAPSDSAGSFLCNYVMYTVQHHIATHRLPMRAGFVHASPLCEDAVLLHGDSSMGMALKQWFEFTEAILYLLCSSVPVAG